MTSESALVAIIASLVGLTGIIMRRLAQQNATLIRSLTKTVDGFALFKEEQARVHGAILESQRAILATQQVLVAAQKDQARALTRLAETMTNQEREHRA